MLRRVTGWKQPAGQWDGIIGKLQVGAPGKQHANQLWLTCVNCFMLAGRILRLVQSKIASGREIEQRVHTHRFNLMGERNRVQQQCQIGMRQNGRGKAIAPVSFPPPRRATDQPWATRCRTDSSPALPKRSALRSRGFRKIWETGGADPPGCYQPVPLE